MDDVVDGPSDSEDDDPDSPGFAIDPDDRAPHFAADMNCSDPLVTASAPRPQSIDDSAPKPREALFLKLCRLLF